MPSEDLRTTMHGPSATFLSRAYSSKTSAENHTLYTSWASSYDKDLTSSSYASPLRAVEAYLLHVPSTSPQCLHILDAGCGTGLQTEILMEMGRGRKFEVDGVDLTPGMLEVARGKGVYRRLWEGNLNERIEYEGGTYDAVLCVGTLTSGHVGPKVFAEFARVVKAGGLVVATVHDEIWESGGYKAEVERLGKEQIVEIVSTAELGIIHASDEGGRMVVLRKS